jgi:hypothetical protein
MSEAITLDSANGWATFVGLPEQIGVPNARGAIRCEVNAKGEIELYPNNALGAYFLYHFGHGDIRPVWTLVASAEDIGSGGIGAFEKLTLRHEPHALLSRAGGDPYHTGVPLSAEEQKACRALVDQMRAEKSAPKPARRKRGAK